MTLDDLLKKTVKANASDLHIKVPILPMIRVNGELIALGEEKKVTPEWTKNTFDTIITQEQKKVFNRDYELDFTYSIKGLARFRANASLQRGSICLVFRHINWDIPTCEQLRLPKIICKLASLPRGLVLITGPTGSGKSTTLAAMIQYINERMTRHIVTIEDPIEYLHRDKRSMISQREIGTDTKSFANALRHTLRQDPDIILIGEMRDPETISIALTAAETGHLVISTLHTPGAAESIDRIVDSFPAYQQHQVREQLAIIIEGIMYQTLLPHKNGKQRVAAFEVMTGTTAIRNLVREGKKHLLNNIIQMSSASGMQSLEQSLALLVEKNLISIEDALSRTNKPEELERLVERSRVIGKR